MSNSYFLCRMIAGVHVVSSSRYSEHVVVMVATDLITCSIPGIPTNCAVDAHTLRRVNVKSLI